MFFFYGLLTAIIADAQPIVDAHHLLLDGSLTDAEAQSRPFVFNTFQDAVANLSDTTVIYIKPWVYWVDNPDTPDVRVGEEGREPFGMVIRTGKLTLMGLSDNPRDVVLASMRGQMQGAVGNFTMFDFHVDSLTVENLTMGNYCNVDLDYAPRPELGRRKRSAAITQAHVGYVHGRSLLARNVRFISRLNLNPLNGADNSLYEDCHFECTDDALNGGNAIYRHCDFDLYGQKPFWSTFGAGPLLVDCDFYVKSDNHEMLFCKQGGPLTLVNCRYHAADSCYVGWTSYPQPWLRCYQSGFTLNGRPYVVGNRQPQNTVILGQEAAGLNAAPCLVVSRREARLTAPATLTLTVEENVDWSVEPGSESFVEHLETHGRTMTATLINEGDDPASFCLVAHSSDGCEAACHLVVSPPQLPAPGFVRRPVMNITGGDAVLGYKLDLHGRLDKSVVTWQRLAADGRTVEATLATGHEGPLCRYRLKPGDVGHRITATITPRHQRSPAGQAVTVCSRVIRQKDICADYNVETDFTDLPLEWQEGLLPDTWTVDGFKPADTSDFDWSFDRQKPMWAYAEGFNGARGWGLVQVQRGARLMYTPAEAPKDGYGDMTITLLVDPTKTAGQGFGSATGQYMDVCLKFDSRSLSGYGLRIIRTVKHAKAVDFLLVAYENGRVRPLTDAVSATCYRTGCTIELTYAGGLLKASVTTDTSRPSGSQLPHEVNLQAAVDANPFGGIHIQHTGSCGESTTMLHGLKCSYNVNFDAKNAQR